MAIYSGFSHDKWGFSIAMLVHQRVFCFFTAPRKNGDDLGVVYGIGFTTLICSEKP
jgi:hypothetical protein